MLDLFKDDLIMDKPYVADQKKAKLAMTEITGGCQCGAVRYKVEKLGRASICHCRMCQKAFGGFFGPLVSVKGLVWTRGERAIFHSSNRNWRGFCNRYGTPLSYEFEIAGEGGKDTGAGIELSIGSLNNPDLAAPSVQINIDSKLHFLDDLFDKPSVKPMQLESEDKGGDTSIISNQHPDFDT